jgi:TatD DNase family protein
VLELVNQYPQEFDDAIPYSIGFTLGILSLIVEADLGIIESKLQEKNCLALGECGLDKGLKSRWNCNKRF